MKSPKESRFHLQTDSTSQFGYLVAVLKGKSPPFWTITRISIQNQRFAVQYCNEVAKLTGESVWKLNPAFFRWFNMRFPPIFETQLEIKIGKMSGKIFFLHNVNVLNAIISGLVQTSKTSKIGTFAHSLSKKNRHLTHKRPRCRLRHEKKKNCCPYFYLKIG